MLVSVLAHEGHLSPNQGDLRRFTGTDDANFAKRKQHALAQEIHDLFNQRPLDEKTKHFSVTGTFTADAIFSLSTVLKHRNIPDLRPSTPDHILSVFKQNFKTYAGIIFNQAVPEELPELAKLIGDDVYFKEALERISAFNSKSQYSMADKGVAARCSMEPVNTFWQDRLVRVAR